MCTLGQIGMVELLVGRIICAQIGTNYSTDLTSSQFGELAEGASSVCYLIQICLISKRKAKAVRNSSRNLEANLFCADSVLHRVIEHKLTFYSWQSFSDDGMSTKYDKSYGNVSIRVALTRHTDIFEGPNLLSALAARGGLAGGGWPDGKESKAEQTSSQSVIY